MDIVKPGYLAEAPRRVLPLFMWLDSRVHELAQETNIERLTDAAADAACQKRRRLRYDPVEWGETDTGRIYGLAINPSGPQEHQGISGEGFEVALRYVRRRTVALKRRR